MVVLAFEGQVCGNEVRVGKVRYVVSCVGLRTSVIAVCRETLNYKNYIKSGPANFNAIKDKKGL